MRKPVSVLAALIVLFSANAAFAGSEAAAGKYIDSVGTKALTTISDTSIPAEKKRATLEKLFQDNLDFDWVGKFVMGRFWREATPDQKTRYLNAYRNFLTKHYTARFSEYTSGNFKVTGSKDLGKDESLVSMEIISGANEPPILIDYKVRKTGGGFKVFDIVVEGVSLLTTQRAEFNAVINKNGIDGLIAQLEAK